jgi:uncharacterized membrane protein
MKTIIKKLFNYFIIGVLAVIPIVVVLEIILFVKARVADLFALVYGYADSYIYTLLVFAVSFIILVALGYEIVKKGKAWIITAFEFVIDRIPFLNTVYRILRKVINMLSAPAQEFAKEIVYVEYPMPGVWVMAYVTNRHEQKYVLFIPTSPNPTSGFTVIVDKSKVIHSAMNIEEVASFIVSLGVDYTKAAESGKLKS